MLWSSHHSLHLTDYEETELQKGQVAYLQKVNTDSFSLKRKNFKIGLNKVGCGKCQEKKAGWFPRACRKGIRNSRGLVQDLKVAAPSSGYIQLFDQLKPHLCLSFNILIFILGFFASKIWKIEQPSTGFDQFRKSLWLVRPKCLAFIITLNVNVLDNYTNLLFNSTMLRQPLEYGNNLYMNIKKMNRAYSPVGREEFWKTLFPWQNWDFNLKWQRSILKRSYM